MDGSSDTTTTHTHCPACQAAVTLVSIPDTASIESWRRPLGGEPPVAGRDHTVSEACPACRKRVTWSPPGVLVDLWKGHGPDPDEDAPIDLGDLD